ncbi:hypothetical protein [Streptomyces sp. NPDC056661]|uniref:hypothetical protein n=1 Tax=Streptomyces sp. NPDC056661 TaxID=3345898 RepID=UPI0036C2C0D3
MVPELIRVLAAADAAESPTDSAKMIGGFAQYGIVGLVVVLLILGVLVPRYVMAALTTEKDNWRTAFEQERAAHQATREQLAKAEEHGDVATEQAKTLIRLLEEFKRRPEAGPGSA